MVKVFLHGLGQDTKSWEATLSFLEEKEDFQCLDLFALVDDENLDYPQLYQDFEEKCLDYDEKLEFCGLSLGATLALDFTLKHSDKVASLVLIAPQYKMPKFLMSLQQLIFLLIPATAFEQVGLPKKQVLTLTKSMMSLDFTPYLSKITCPVLVLCGTRDKSNKKASQSLAVRLLQGQLTWIAGAGHEVNQDKPEVLGKILTDFYSKGLTPIS